MHDNNFLKELELIPYSMLVFDRAYNYYHQFALWTSRSVFFVTRIKKDALFTVVEVLQGYQKQKGKAMLLREEIIEIEYSPEDENRKKQTKKREPLV